MNFRPFPEIETKRLLLRKIESTDADVILFLRTDATVTKYIERPEHRKTKNLAEAQKFIVEITTAFENQESYSWGITLPNTPEIIGTICFWNFSENKKIAEIGYDLRPEFQHMGFMNEALTSIVDFGFMELKLDSIEAFTHKENDTSRKLLAKNGFIQNASRKDLQNDFNSIFELHHSK